MKKIMLVFIVLFFFLGFLMQPISEVIHDRNPFIDIIFGPILMGLFFAVFGAFIGFILIQKENFLLQYSASFLGILFGLILFLNESNIIRKGTSFGKGDVFDFFLGSIGLLFIVLFLIYFYIISLKKKKAGESYKREFYLPLIFAPMFGFYILQGFGYGFLFPIVIIFISLIFYIISFIKKTKNN